MNNPIFNMFGGMQNFMTNFNSFRQQMEQTGSDPRQRANMQAQSMLDSGKINQDQYNQILNMAGTIRQLFR